MSNPNNRPKKQKGFLKLNKEQKQYLKDLLKDYVLTYWRLYGTIPIEQDLPEMKEHALDELEEQYNLWLKRNDSGFKAYFNSMVIVHINHELERKENIARGEKKQLYSQLIPQVKSLIKGIDNRDGALANVAALLHDTLPYFFWIGFYIVRNDQLELGPFQGPVACYTISKGKGVCGTAWEKAETIVVPDVEQFPGHIACSSKSRSEIVLPIRKNGEVVAVLDVDSTGLNTFSEEDREGLEKVAEIISGLF
jgi:GAF domain-containing protein